MISDLPIFRKLGLYVWLSRRIFLPTDFQRNKTGDKMLFGMWRIQKSVGDLSQNHFSVTIGLVIGSGDMR